MILIDPSADVANKCNLRLVIIIIKFRFFIFIFKIEKSEDICVYDFQVFFNSADFDDQVWSVF
jgi:hypothetical protein